MTMSKKKNSQTTTVTTSDGRGVDVSTGFICPITSTVMVNPMMTRNSLNFERSAILAWLETNSASCPITGQPMNVSDILPNHALASQIRGWQKNNGLNVAGGEEEESTKPDGKDIAVPPNFVCPISSRIMVSPVMTRDGRSFERCAILSWLEKGRGVCPITGRPLAACNLLPHRALEAQIAFWRKNNDIVVIEECHHHRASDGNDDGDSSGDFVGFLRVSSNQNGQEAVTTRGGKHFEQQQQKHSLSTLMTISTSPDIVSTAPTSASIKGKRGSKKSSGGRRKFMSRILSAASAELDDL